MGKYVIIINVLFWVSGWGAWFESMINYNTLIVASIAMYVAIDVVRDKMTKKNNIGDDAMRNILSSTFEAVKSFFISLLAGATLNLR